MRTYREQFEQETADRIALVIKELEELRYPTGPSRYYGLDLVNCLHAGALAGSLVVASALMELYVRGLIIHYSESAQSGWSQQVETERELENMKNLKFSDLLERLVKTGLFDSEDAELAKEIYKTVRIPAHHGLPDRLINKSDDNLSQEIFGIVRRAGPVSMKDFEYFIESEALPTIEAIIALMCRNQIQQA